MGQVFGRIPPGVEIPLLPMSRWRVIRSMIPVVASIRRRVAANQKRLPEFLAGSPARCDTLRARITAAPDRAELIRLWEAELLPYFREASHMLEAAGRLGGSALVMLRRDLQKLVGEADTNALTSGLQGGDAHLASLGPLIGLMQLARGEIDRGTYVRRHGHRGPHEFEVSMPRPGEDPGWIDKQLAGLQEASQTVTDLLARQEKARAAAWDRLAQLHPRKVRSMRRRVGRWSAAARAREAARSEVIRAFWALRTFVQRAGVLTSRGDDLFFLSVDEVLGLLRGDEAVLSPVPVRRATYERYRALPPYPTLIRGRFDPFRWAADPNRRSDLFDARGERTPASDTITGFPGAAGVVEGVARVIPSTDEGDRLRPGEILVTTVTNIGWTPLFPRAGAVVTDVGAPLSHAAIVARELGIPAVVGCGNATMRLHTGDRLRVDGERGTVEILEPAATPS
jgi:pyruvate,water dikinase